MPYLPAFTVTFSAVTGAGTTPPFQPVASGVRGAIWMSKGRTAQQNRDGAPPIVAQIAVAVGDVAGYDPPGWDNAKRVFRAELGHVWSYSGFLSDAVTPVWKGAMWLGTENAHTRFDCCRAVAVGPSGGDLIGDPMVNGYGITLPNPINATFDIYRPFGAAIPTLSAAPGSLYSDVYGGRGSYSGGNYFVWTDVLQCRDSVDIRDGVSRAAGLDVLSYSDGDEVRFPTGIAVTRYVVTRVTRVADRNGVPYKRVYLIRDQPHWPGP